MATFCFSPAQSGYAAAIIPDNAAVRSQRSTAPDRLICDKLKLEDSRTCQNSATCEAGDTGHALATREGNDCLRIGSTRKFGT